MASAPIPVSMLGRQSATRVDSLAGSIYDFTMAAGEDRRPAEADSISPEDWLEELSERIHTLGPRACVLAEAERALEAYPRDAPLLNLAALAALLEEKPAKTLRFLKRLKKYYVPQDDDHLLEALALAQQERWFHAHRVLKQRSPQQWIAVFRAALFAGVLDRWLSTWIRRVHSEMERIAQAERQKHAPRRPASRGDEAPPQEDRPAHSARFPELRRVEAHIPLQLDPNLSGIEVPDERTPCDAGALRWFELRHQFSHLRLLQSFDELLCLPHLFNVETYWYQVETARKVLKQFHGRVLLADEVGLGKTIEAGMVLKEYLLRGMVDSVLVLTPPSLVGQWREEMESKFGVSFATSQDPLLSEDPEQFWQQPRIIASLAAARLPRHGERLQDRQFDLVIVDEAHHLKNRRTRNWRLVDGLKKRFLLLLSATPVQNSLVELYNLLTLLKPGIFHTEKEFRHAYLTPGNARVPANRERLHHLMRDVMIRNTRSLVDVRLPPRHAATVRLDPGSDEEACYRDLARSVRAVHEASDGQDRLALQHLLLAAGSSPHAAAAALERWAVRERQNGGEREFDWTGLHRRYRDIACGVKGEALLELVRKNPGQKVMVFAQRRHTLDWLGSLLHEEGIRFARFEGSLSGPEKDASIERFREHVPVLLCSETGGEGRNVQFCNTLINVDLPWNPMQLEQRIGRIHRIGQQREVFVFNLVVRGTLEEEVLRLLDEKIHMFELVVGEIGEILGALDEKKDFASLVFDAWVGSHEEQEAAFEALGSRLVQAKSRYESFKELDDELFGEEFETA